MSGRAPEKDAIKGGDSEKVTLIYFSTGLIINLLFLFLNSILFIFGVVL